MPPCRRWSHTVLSSGQRHLQALLLLRVMQCHAIVPAVIAYSAATSVCEKECSVSRPHISCERCRLMPPCRRWSQTVLPSVTRLRALENCSALRQFALLQSCFSCASSFHIKGGSCEAEPVRCSAEYLTVPSIPSLVSAHNSSRALEGIVCFAASGASCSASLLLFMCQQLPHFSLQRLGNKTAVIAYSAATSVWECSTSRPYIFNERCSAMPPCRRWSHTVLSSARAKRGSSTSSDAVLCHRVGCDRLQCWPAALAGSSGTLTVRRT